MWLSKDFPAEHKVTALPPTSKHSGPGHTASARPGAQLHTRPPPQKVKWWQCLLSCNVCTGGLSILPAIADSLSGQEGVWLLLKPEMFAITVPSPAAQDSNTSSPAHSGVASIAPEATPSSHLLAFREVDKGFLWAPSEMQWDPSAAAL